MASDLKTGKKLWDLAIYQTKIDSDLEEDVQWVFITSLKLDGDSLIVQDEKGSRYRVNLTSITVKKLISERTILLWSLLVLAAVLISWFTARARARRYGSLVQQQ